MNFTNSELEIYIEKNSISEAKVLLFRKWDEFLALLFSCGGRVEMIVWYEYCKINEQQIGMGGYTDQENIGYMWAETQLFETDLQVKSLNEIFTYISGTRNKYTAYDLYPEFYICRPEIGRTK